MSEPQTPPPPMRPELLAMLESAKPSEPRRPHRQVFAFAVCAALACTAMVAVSGLRADFSALGLGYHAVMLLAWVLAFGTIGRLAIVPRPGSSLVRWKLAATSALGIAVGAVALGLLWTESAPGLSKTYDLSVENVVRHAPGCLVVGMVTALAPLMVAALALRSAIPRGAGWVGAALGAASGCAGGLALHLLCGVAEPTHVGLVHGGTVLVAACLGGLLLRRALRT